MARRFQCLLGLGLAASGAATPVVATPDAAASSVVPSIAKIQTDRARYAPGTPVLVRVTLTGGHDKKTNVGTISLACQHLDEAVPGPPAAPFRLAAGATQTLTFRWQPPRKDFQGYVIAARVRDTKGHMLGSRTTAVDVSSVWTHFVRYGYLSAFSPQTAAVSRQVIRQLADFHLDALQYYDWQYRHETPLAGSVERPAPTWKNLANKTNARQTILDLISAGHAAGIAAMNYNLLYGAWSGYAEQGVDSRWALWRKPNATEPYSLPMPGGWATPRIDLFNPANPDWQRFLVGQEARVFAAYPFDGWHVDQIGPPPGPVYDAAGMPVDVWPAFKPFLDAAQKGLDKPLIFNNVGGYGLFDTAAHTDDVAVYVECWPFMGQKTYNDLKTVIEQSASWSGGKSVVLPAYMNTAYGNTFGGKSPGAFNTPGVLLTDAAIFASGGTHLEIGDGGADSRMGRGVGMLNNEYFPNHNLAPTPALLRALSGYYDFQVAYENLLHLGGSDSLAPCEANMTLNVPTSANAAPDTVWAFARASPGRQVLHLINLRGESDTVWKDDQANHPIPTPQTSLDVTYYCGSSAVQKVCVATPDGGESSDIRMQPLTFTRGADTKGPFVRFRVPRLDYWDMVVLTTAHN